MLTNKLVTILKRLAVVLALSMILIPAATFAEPNKCYVGMDFAAPDKIIHAYASVTCNSKFQSYLGATAMEAADKCYLAEFNPDNSVAYAGPSGCGAIQGQADETTKKGSEFDQLGYSVLNILDSYSKIPDAPPPSGGTPALPPGQSPGSTPTTTGTAPTANNPAAPDPDQPAITDRCTTVNGKPDPNQTGCGFESTNQCQAGNQGKDCSITDRLNTIASFLSAGVGIIIVIMIIIGGIQYTTAGGDPGRVAQAKNRILNAIYALIAFFFLYAFLQWIVPGGLF